MAEADGKSTVLNGKGSVLENISPQPCELPCLLAVNERTCLLSPGGSEEKEPGKDQHKEGDASGSKEGQTQSSSPDGNPILVV